MGPFQLFLFSATASVIRKLVLYFVYFVEWSRRSRIHTICKGRPTGSCQIHKCWDIFRALAFEADIMFSRKRFRSSFSYPAT